MDILLSTDWLAERLETTGLAVVDASWFLPGAARDPRAEFVAGHIPGAVFFDIDEVSDHSDPLPHMLPSSQEFATHVRRMGIGAGDQVVVYDSEGLLPAARVWWTFRAMGHTEVAVLDGGLPRWLAEGRPVETGWREKPHAEFKAHLDDGLVRNLAQVRGALGTDGTQIVDARPAGRFTGEAPEPRAGLRSGHMPGAISMPLAAVVADGRLKAPEDLARAFAAAGVDPAEPMIATCGSGITAAVLALAAARLGHDRVAVYDGSWSEWGGRDDTPVVAGA